MSKFILSILIFSSFIFVFSSSAQTTTPDLQAIIKQLQEQIRLLNQQIAELQSSLKETQKEVEIVKAELKITKSLRKGESGDEVKQLQEFLKQFPDIYPEGIVTGFFGSLTETAVKRFQEKHGIESIGIVGPKTIQKLSEFSVSAIPAIPAVPAIPGVSPAIPAIPAIPASPSLPLQPASSSQPIVISAIPATPAIPAVPGSSTAIPAVPAQPSSSTSTPTPTSYSVPPTDRTIPTITFIKEIVGLYDPTGIAISPTGEIYVADFSNSNVKIYDASYNYLRTLGSTHGSAPGQFSYPWDIAFDSSGNAFITDSSNSRVQVFSPSGAYLKGFSSLAYQGIAVNGGELFYVSGRSIEIFNKNGQKTGNLPFGSNFYPRNIAIDKNNRIYFSNFGNIIGCCTFDSNSNSFTIQDPNGNLIRKVPLDYQPFFISIDSKFRIWIADYNNAKVKVYDSTGDYITEFGLSGITPGAGSIVGLEIHNDKLYISSFKIDKVLVYSIGSAITQPATPVQPSSSTTTPTPTVTVSTSPSPIASGSVIKTPTPTPTPTPTSTPASVTQSPILAYLVWGKNLDRQFIRFGFNVFMNGAIYTPKTFIIYLKGPSDNVFKKYSTISVQQSVNASGATQYMCNNWSICGVYTDWQEPSSYSSSLPNLNSGPQYLGEYQYYATEVDINNGIESAPTPVRTATLYPAPTIVNPANGSTVLPLSLRVTINNISPVSANKYQVALWRSDGQRILFRDMDTSDTTFYVPELTASGNPFRLVAGLYEQTQSSLHRDMTQIAAPITFYVSSPTPTPTPTPTPMPTPAPTSSISFSPPDSYQISAMASILDALKSILQTLNNLLSR